MSLSSQTLQVNYLTQNEAILLAWEHFPFVPSLPSTQSWRHILGCIFPQGYLPVRYSPPCPRSLSVEKTERSISSDGLPQSPSVRCTFEKGNCSQRNEIVYVILHSHFGFGKQISLKLCMWVEVRVAIVSNVFDWVRNPDILPIGKSRLSILRDAR